MLQLSKSEKKRKPNASDFNISLLSMFNIGDYSIDVNKPQ